MRGLKLERAKLTVTNLEGRRIQGRKEHHTYHVSSIHQGQSLHLHSLHDLCNRRENVLEYVSLHNSDPNFANSLQSSQKPANAPPSSSLSLHSSTIRQKPPSQFSTPITASSPRLCTLTPRSNPPTPSPHPLCLPSTYRGTLKGLPPPTPISWTVYRY